MEMLIVSEVKSLLARDAREISENSRSLTLIAFTVGENPSVRKLRIITRERLNFAY